MKIFVDNELIEQENVDGVETVEDALQQIQAEFGPLGRMVVSVRCDGKEVPANEMAKTLGQPVDTFERVDVVTGTKEGLVIEAMTQATACIGDTEETCRKVAELLKQGDTVEATQTLGKCLLIWQQIHEAVGKSIEMLGLDPLVRCSQCRPYRSALPIHTSDAFGEEGRAKRLRFLSKAHQNRMRIEQPVIGR